MRVEQRQGCIVTKAAEDSRRWWMHQAKNRQYIIDVIGRRIQQLEADYDLVEAELRQRVEACTCHKDGN